MATTYMRVNREMQASEATTVRRTFIVELGTAEATTITVRKAGAGATFSASTATAALLSGTLYEVTVPTADLDTEGALVYRLAGATSVTLAYGLSVVQHDPYADIAAILDDTGTSGVKLGTAAIGTAQFATGAITADAIASAALTAAKFAAACLPLSKFDERSQFIGQEWQKNETTTALRTLDYLVGTAEAQTVTVSKAGGAFGAVSGAAAAVAGNVYKLTMAAADLDTNGDLVFKSAGATNTQYIHAGKVVNHDPASDLNFIARRVGLGLVVYDNSAGTIKVYDGAADTDALLGTETRTTSGSKVLWTPS